jgi:hypothetical protein
MSLQFHRADEDLKIWIASSDGFSFVITYESSTGPGFHGRPGYVASWRSRGHSLRIGAVRITGSPFRDFADAEQACNGMLKHLSGETDAGAT